MNKYEKEEEEEDDEEDEGTAVAHQVKWPVGSSLH